VTPRKKVAKQIHKKPSLSVKQVHVCLLHKR
jgi:hypothetical protein